jgi:hypothetical protein
MLHDWILGRSRRFADVFEPRLRNAPLAFVVGQLRGSGVLQSSFVGITGAGIQRVNLAESFLRVVVGELPERLGPLQAIPTAYDELFFC